MSFKRTAAVLSVLAAIAAGGVYSMGWDRAVLAALGIETEDDVDRQFAALNPETLDWLDLVPPAESETATRLRDGALPRGVLQHGQLGPNTPPGPGEIVPPAENAPPDLARLLGGYGNLDAPPRRLSDTMGGLGSLKGLQPRTGSIRKDLDGRAVRIAGFVTPLSFSGGRISEFLLVPYVGACIHVPPPPANQIVFVSDPRGLKPEGGLLYPVWITGTLLAVPLETGLADVGYQIKGARIERYE